MKILKQISAETQTYMYLEFHNWNGIMIATSYYLIVQPSATKIKVYSNHVYGLFTKCLLCQNNGALHLRCRLPITLPACLHNRDLAAKYIAVAHILSNSSIQQENFCRSITRASTYIVPCVCAASKFAWLYTYFCAHQLRHAQMWNYSKFTLSARQGLVTAVCPVLSSAMAIYTVRKQKKGVWY